MDRHSQLSDFSNKLDKFLAVVWDHEGAEGLLSCLHWLPGSLCVVKETRILACEEGLESLLGYQRNELWGSDLHQIISPSEFERVWAALAPEGAGQCYTHYYSKGGESVYVELFAHVLAVNGEPILLISSLEQADARQQEEIYRLRHLVELGESLGLSGTWTLDVTTNTLFWDEGTRRLHGLPEDEHPTVETAIDYYHPDDRLLISSAVENCIQQGKSYDLNLRIVSAQGEVRWVRTLGEARYRDNEVVSIFGIIQDITQILHHRQQEKRLDTVLSAISNGMSTSIGKNFLENLVDQLSQVTSFKCVFLAKVDTTQNLASTLVFRLNGHVAGNMEYVLDDTPCENIVAQGECLFKNGVQELFPLDLQLQELNAQSYAGAPLLGTGGEILGLLVLIDDKPIEDEKLISAIFSLFSGRASAELERILIQEKYTNALAKTVEALATTIGQRDSYTAEHQRNVSKISTSIAREMKLDPEHINAVSLASSVHDIGKISIPADILSKPGKLNDLEYALIKTHSERGHDILKDMDLPWGIAEMVLQHHERLDGSGYPNGLRGKEINLGARIIAVADVADAMVSHRPYRPALGLASALEELENGSGTRYDPDVVSAYLNLVSAQMEQGFN